MVFGSRVTEQHAGYRLSGRFAEAPRRCQMSENSFRQELQGFARELRQLAYTMPAGHEDRLISLSERMVARSQQTRRIGSRGA